MSRPWPSAVAIAVNPSLHPAHAPYSVVPIKPHPTPLFAVTVIFNPQRYLSRYRLYKAFAKHMADGGTQLLTVEIAFGDREFEVTELGNPWHLQLRTKSNLWHKERALNLGFARLTQLVPDWKFGAWIDADITFYRPDWAQETIHMLEHHPVVQMFGVAANMDPQGYRQWCCESAFRQFVEKRIGSGTDFYGKGVGGHPGLAWACTRSAFETMGGLIDFCPAGGGDTYMANALRGYWQKGDSNHKTITEFSPEFVREVNTWADRVAAFKQNVGYVHGTVAHHWHGNSFQRGHKIRWDALMKHQFNPRRDLEPDAQGLYRWTGNKPELEGIIQGSFIHRNEDSVDVIRGQQT
jgi:hypothetical protein